MVVDYQATLIGYLDVLQGFSRKVLTDVSVKFEAIDGFYVYSGNLSKD